MGVVPVPQVVVEEVVRQVPRVMVQEVVRQVPRVQVQEVVKQLPAPVTTVQAAPPIMQAAPVTTVQAAPTYAAPVMETYAAPVMETFAPAYAAQAMALQCWPLRQLEAMEAMQHQPLEPATEPSSE